MVALHHPGECYAISAGGGEFPSHHCKKRHINVMIYISIYNRLRLDNTAVVEWEGK